MSADLVAKLAERGITGLLLAVALWVILKLYETNQAAHLARVTAAEEYRRQSELAAENFRAKQEQAAAAALATATRMVEACTAAIVAQTNVTVGHEKGLRELKELFEEYVEEVRRTSR